MQTLWRDLTTDCDILGPYYTSNGPFNAKEMLACVMEALRKFHCHGFDVYAMVCDGASSNLTMVKMLLGKQGHFATNASLPNPHFTKCDFINPFTGKSIYCIICPSHQVLFLKYLVAIYLLGVYVCVYIVCTCICVHVCTYVHMCVYVCDSGLAISDVQYISISRYFCSYRTVSKSILHLLMLDNYRTAEFSNNISNYQA